MNDFVSLYATVVKLGDKINEIIKVLNDFDPELSKNYVKSVNGKTGEVTITGNDIAYDGSYSVNAKIDKNLKTASDLYNSLQSDIANLSLPDILGSSSAQTQIMTNAAFSAITESQWTEFYNNGFRVVGVVNPDFTSVINIYLQDSKSPHKPIPLAASGGGGDVQSVNGKTGAVNLTGEDINLSTADTTKINTAIQTVEGDAANALAEAREAYSATNPPPYPVKSVDGKTGEVQVVTVVNFSNGMTITPGLYYVLNVPVNKTSLTPVDKTCYCSLTTTGGAWQTVPLSVSAATNRAAEFVTGTHIEQNRIVGYFENVTQEGTTLVIPNCTMLILTYDTTTLTSEI